jgi:hypothetical protein
MRTGDDRFKNKNHGWGSVLSRSRGSKLSEARAPSEKRRSLTGEGLDGAGLGDSYARSPPDQ